MHLFWAGNNFDVTMEKDTLEEAELDMVDHLVVYASALHITKLLIPGCPSYALEALHNHLGFGSYDAHDAMADVLAAWRCLLYAVQCHVGWVLN